MLRVFVFDIGRRWGKTFLVLLIRLEDCLRRPGSNHTYATAFQKDIGEIVQPMVDEICEDAPEDCMPVFQKSKDARQMGYYLPNNSRLRLVGLDLHPKGLRGGGMDGCAITEAGYVRNLASTVGKVIYAQFQRRPHATLILESNAPEDEDHDFDTKFVPDAKLRDAYVFQTIDDNEAITDEEKKESFDAVAAITSHDDAMREFYGVRYRDPKRLVCAEYVRDRHMRAVRRPSYAKAFCAGDPGMSDMFGLLWGYWNFETAQLVIERDWAAANAPTHVVMAELRTIERELWGTAHKMPAPDRHLRKTDEPMIWIDNAVKTTGGKVWKTPFTAFTWWDGEQFQANPSRRYCDRELRTISDMRHDHEVEFVATSKDDLEAMCNAIRTAFLRDKIVISPACVALDAHLTAAKWDKARVKWERHPQLGHFDLVAALIYLWRNVDRVADPNPPPHWDRADILMGHHPGWKDAQKSSRATSAIADALDSGGYPSAWR